MEPLQGIRPVQAKNHPPLSGRMSFPLGVYNALLWTGILLFFPLIGVYFWIFPKARAGFRQKIGFYPSGSNPSKVSAHPIQSPFSQTVWVHCVSVGEFNAVRPLIEDLISASSLKIVITTTTRTGQALAQSVFSASPRVSIGYFPYDFRGAIMKAFEWIKPDLIVLTETELWPNFIDIAQRIQHCPVITVNGRISPRSFQGYQKIFPLMHSMLGQLTHLYMQSQGDKDRIQKLGAPSAQVSVSGNIKYDISPEVDLVKQVILKNLLGFDLGPQGKDALLVMASTHLGEDLPLVNVFLTLKRDFPELKLMLAPRHPERVPEIKTSLKRQGIPFSVRSQLSETQPNLADVVILDTIGELTTVFSFSKIAVIGGSFVPKGGHNPLEAIAQNIPVVYGPHMFNFKDMSQVILEAHAGIQISETGLTEAGKWAEPLVAAITALLTQPEYYATMVENGKALLEENRGAKAFLLKAIHSHLMGETPESSLQDTRVSAKTLASEAVPV
ncbi:MAG: 3-deoxy-D-manno-octulosonic acid transferase [Cyanobacteria bacterium]|nr:3-deoxy-D-manno-octulosonic acid transferase [Cyanobacteriota bacterium]